MARRRPGPSTAVGLGAGLACFLVGVVANRDLLAARILEDGDFGANSILIDRALDGRLLVGNYSRVGFHHPGPAILDVQAAGQVVFHRLLGLVPTPFNGHFLGILALNAACLGVAAAIVRRRFGSTAAALALPAVALVLDSWEPWILTSTWMPHTYVAPFLLLCVAAASVGTGSRHDLRWLAVAVGLLVHGHVSFLMFTGVTATVAMAGGWAVRRREAGPAEDGSPRRHWAWAAGVAALFAAPTLLHTLLDWPGELERYLDYSGDRSAFADRTFADILGFLGRYWSWGGAMGAAVLAGSAVAATLTVVLRRRRWRLPLAGLAVVVAVEAVLVVVYAWRGVDELGQPYIGLFAYTGPVLVLWAGVVAVLGWVEEVPAPAWRRSLGAVVVAAVAASTALTGAVANPYRGMPRGADLVSAAGPGAIRVDFATPGWPTAVGLVEQLRRRGREVCVVNPVWTVLVTEEVICEEGARGRLLVVYGPGDTPAPGRVVYDDGVNVVVAPN